MRVLVGVSSVLLMAACAGRSESSVSAGPARCSEKGEALEIRSLEVLQRHLIGRWTFCGGTQLGQRAHDGIEFAADGRWYFLQRAGDGTLTRQRGFDAGGSWSTGAYAMTPPMFNPTIDVQIGQQGQALSVAFQAQPSAMRIQWADGPVDYVASDQRPLYAGPLPPAPAPSGEMPWAQPPPPAVGPPRFACEPGPPLQINRLFFDPEVDSVARYTDTWIATGKRSESEERGMVCGKAKSRSACLSSLARARDVATKPARCHDEAGDPACIQRSVVITRGNDARALRSAAEARAQLGRIDSREEARWLLELEHQDAALCYAPSAEGAAPFQFTFVPPCAYAQGAPAFLHHATVAANGEIKESREPTTDPAARWCNR